MISGGSDSQPVAIPHIRGDLARTSVPTTTSVRVHQSLAALQDLIFSTRCLICADPGPIVCAICREPWQRPARAIPRSPAGVPVHVVRLYDRAARELILAVKEDGLHAAEPVLAEAIAIACLPLLAPRPDTAMTLVPIPSRPAARRARGRDVLWAITRRSAALLAESGWSVTAERLLTHTRRVADQSDLSARERIRNVEGSMTIRSRRSGIGSIAPTTGGSPAIMEVIVVDDLITTGATMREAVRVLRSSVTVVGGACAASTALQIDGRQQ